MKATRPSSSSSSHSPSSTSEWAWLPHNVLLLILNKLLLLSEMVKFSSVCTNWYYVAKGRFHALNLHPYVPLNRNLPVLLIPSTERNGSRRNFYSVDQRTIYGLNLQVPYKKRCCGSSHGWLITIDGDSCEVNLINPFYFGNSKGIIHVPRFSTVFDLNEEIGPGLNSDCFVSKAILSSDPIKSPNEFILMVIYGNTRKLAFWKAGSQGWTYITWCLPQFFDVIYVQDRFLAVNSLGQIYSCETDVVDYTYNLCTFSGPFLGLLGACCWRYLVELPDRTILQAIRTLKFCICDKYGPVCTTGFIVHKLVVNEDGRHDWVSVESLEGGALFLGDNYSQYVSVSQFPGCRPNSIYFTDDYPDSDAVFQNYDSDSSPFVIGVFLLDEGRIERYYIPVPQGFPFPPPIWILPTI